MTTKLILIPLLAYLFGSVPCGIILTRLFSGVDIRKSGSKNIGAYNVFRLTGVKLGAITLAGDLLKGALPVVVALHWVEFSGWKGELYFSPTRRMQSRRSASSGPRADGSLQCIYSSF